MKRKEVVLIVLHDFSKGFDAVCLFQDSDKQIVLLRFFEELFRLANELFQWPSNPTPAHFGIPQGSILGPSYLTYMFQIYKIYMFTDLQDLYVPDLQMLSVCRWYTVCICSAASSINSQAGELNSSLDALRQWSSNLALNSKKTKTMLFPTSQMP